ncbi:MAG TPA: peptidoglycan DD-metalloendopeptidase family protein [Symbiobacteriaceae bacterium]
MKPAQGLSADWLSQLPRERRNVLLTALVLTGILGTLVLYGRWRGEIGIGPGPAPLAEEPAVTAQAPEAAEPSLSAAAPAEVTGADGAPAEPSQQDGASAEGKAPELGPVRLQMPLAGDPPILQPYQFAFSPIYEDYRLHPGIDFAAAEGEQVLAAAAGTVAAVEVDPAEGTAVVLDHGGGLMTRYAGLGKVTVYKHARVAAGDVLGTVGRPVGGGEPYLHFEVLQDGESLDPSPYLFQ